MLVTQSPREDCVHIRLCHEVPGGQSAAWGRWGAQFNPQDALWVFSNGLLFTKRTDQFQYCGRYCFLSPEGSTSVCRDDPGRPWRAATCFSLVSFGN